MTAAACSEFAAELPAGTRYQSIAPRRAPVVSSSVAAAWRSAANVGSVMLTVDVGRLFSV